MEEIGKWCENILSSTRNTNMVTPQEKTFRYSPLKEKAKKCNTRTDVFVKITFENLSKIRGVPISSSSAGYVQVVFVARPRYSSGSSGVCLGNCGCPPIDRPIFHTVRLGQNFFALGASLLTPINICSGSGSGIGIILGVPKARRCSPPSCGFDTGQNPVGSCHQSLDDFSSAAYVAKLSRLASHLWSEQARSKNDTLVPTATIQSSYQHRHRETWAYKTLRFHSGGFGGCNPTGRCVRNGSAASQHGTSLLCQVLQQYTQQYGVILGQRPHESTHDKSGRIRGQGGQAPDERRANSQSRILVWGVCGKGGGHLLLTGESSTDHCHANSLIAWIKPA